MAYVPIEIYQNALAKLAAMDCQNIELFNLTITNEIPSNSGICLDKYLQVIVDATREIERLLKKIGLEGDYEEDSMGEYEHSRGSELISNFDYVFPARVIKYSFEENILSKRIAISRIWDLQDGAMFEELSAKRPFDSNGHVQSYFFWGKKMLHGLSCSWTYPNEYTEDKHLADIIRSIECLNDPVIALEGETSVTGSLRVDYHNGKIIFERSFFKPATKVYEIGSMSFSQSVDLLKKDATHHELRLKHLLSDPDYFSDSD